MADYRTAYSQEDAQKMRKVGAALAPFLSSGQHLVIQYKKAPRRPDLPGERSPLWNMAAFGSLAGGVAYGMKGSWGQFSSAFHQAPLTSPVETFAMGATSLRTNRPVQTNLAEQVLSDVGTYSFKPGVSKNILGALQTIPDPGRSKQEVALLTYEALIKTGRVSRGHAMDIFQELRQAKTIEEAYGSAETYVKQFRASAPAFRARLQEYMPWWAPGEGPLAMKSQAWSGMTSEGPWGFGHRRPGGFVGESAHAQRNIIYDMFEKAGLKVENARSYVIEEAGVTTPMWTAVVEGNRISLPLEETGYTYGGRELSTRYATRRFMDPSGQTMSYTDYYLDQIRQLNDRNMSDSAKRRALASVNESMTSEMFSRAETAASKGAIWTLPEQVAHTGARAQARLNQMQVLAGQLSPQEFEDMLATGKLFPYGSGAVVAKQTVMSQNVATGLYGELGALFPVEKEPLKGIRGNFGVSPLAIEAMEEEKFAGTFGELWGRRGTKIRGPLYEKVLAETGHEGAQLMAFYAKPGAELGFQSKALSEMISPEEALVSRRAARMLRPERITPQEILLTEGMEKRKEIIKALAEVGPGQIVQFDEPLRAGIGVSPMGERILAEEGDEAAVAVERINKERARVYMRKTYSLDPAEGSMKLFGPGVKHQAHVVSDDMMRDAIAKAGGSGLASRKIANQTVDMVLNAADLSKNRYAMTVQQISGLATMASSNIEDLTVEGRAEARAFISDPIAFLKQRMGTKRLLAASQEGADFELQKNMVALGRRFRLNQEQMGLVFGMMDPERAGKLGIAEAVAASQGVLGAAAPMVGDIASEMGAGGLGTFEPTLYRSLATKGYGEDIGARVVAELVGRRAGTEALAPAEKMMAGLAGQVPITEKAKGLVGMAEKGTPIGELAGESIFSAKGRWIETGRKMEAWGGSSRFYLPGTEEMPSLLGRTKGEIPSILERELKDLRGAVAAGADDVEDIASRLRNVAYSAYAKEASGRGRILGSASLTARSFAPGGASRIAAPDAFDIHYVSKERGTSMIDDLVKATDVKDTASIEFLKGQRKQLLAGEAIPAMVWRHPGTGPESTQFARLAIEKGLGAEEIRVPITRATMIEEKIIEGKRVSKSIMADVGPTVGMKADFDMDRINIAVISNRDTASRLNRIRDTQIRTSYAQYIHDHFAMKQAMEEVGTQDIAKMSLRERMVGGFRRLTTAKTTTGQVNLALQRLKLGLQYGAPEEYRPAAELLWHMEEAVIGGKKGVREASLYRGIASAVQEKDAAKFEQNVTALFGPARELRAKITDIPGVDVSKLRPVQYDPGRTAKVLMGAMEPIESEIDDIIGIARASKKVGDYATLDKITREMATHRFSGVDPGMAAVRAAAEGRVTKTAVAEKALRRAAGTWARVKSVAAKAKGPALIGAVAAGAILAASPSVSGSLPRNRNVEGPAGGRNLTKDSLMMMPSGPGMNPPPPRIMSPKKVYDGISSAPISARADVKMHLDDAEIRAEQLSRRARELTDSSNVSIRYRDDREALDPAMLANRIYRRL
jgi:hypothetical protein